MTKYPEDVRALIRDMLSNCELPRDALPYSETFAKLRTQFETQQQTSIEEVDFWRMVSNIAKDGGEKRGRSSFSLTSSVTLA